MRPADTSLGGPGNAFPETASQLRSCFRNPASESYREGLTTLCRQYWKPIYAFVRAAWAKSSEDAKDLTQAFLLWLLGGDALRRFEPELGGFRPYLKVLLRRFVAHRDAALHALKRGGAARLVSFDRDEVTLAESVLDPRAADPEKVFEDAWVSEVIDQAVRRVRERKRARGNPLPFEVYEAHTFGAGPERPSYAELAARFGLKEGDVKRHLFTVREEILAEVRQELARMTVDDRELQDEWKRLFGA